MYQDYFTTMMDKHDVIGEINAEVLLVLIDKIEQEDTPESREFMQALIKEVEANQLRTQLSLGLVCKGGIKSTDLIGAEDVS